MISYKRDVLERQSLSEVRMGRGSGSGACRCTAVRTVHTMSAHQTN